MGYGANQMWDGFVEALSTDSRIRGHVLISLDGYISRYAWKREVALGSIVYRCLLARHYLCMGDHVSLIGYLRRAQLALVLLMMPWGWE